MNLEIPKPLTIEHEALHAELVKLTERPGAVGTAARNVARLLHPHFGKEEAYALPRWGSSGRSPGAGSPWTWRSFSP